MAALALAKQAYAINQNGMRYTDGNIEGLLNERHMAGKVRRAGGRIKGVRKRTGEEDRIFESMFRKLLEEKE